MRACLLGFNLKNEKWKRMDGWMVSDFDVFKFVWKEEGVVIIPPPHLNENDSNGIVEESDISYRRLEKHTYILLCLFVYLL